jgi:hypothetical protein
MSNTTVDAEQPDLSTFVGPVAVPVETADKLAVIAQLEDQTLTAVIRQALTSYASGYMDYLAALETGPDE